MPIDLNQMRVFVEVVRRGSFGGAAEALQMPKSTVSLRVRQLEERLGLRLLQRSTRKLSLTDKGQHYYDDCARIVTQAEEADRSLAALGQGPHGTLRVASYQMLADLVLAPVFAEFLQAHREVRLEVSISEGFIDLLGESIDLAIRTAALGDSSLIARKLGEFDVWCCAAPGFLAEHPSLRSPRDLTEVDLVPYGTSFGTPWLFHRESERVEIPSHGRFTANSIFMVTELTRRGLGVGGVPQMLAEEEVRADRLVRLFEDWRSPPLPIYAIYPSRAHMDPALTALLGLLVERVTTETLRSSSVTR